MPLAAPKESNVLSNGSIRVSEVRSLNGSLLGLLVDVVVVLVMVNNV